MIYVVIFLLATVCQGADLRVGLIGTDTSHAVAFAQLLNDPSSANHIPGARIVAAYKGGSPDLPESADRVDKFADELKSKWRIRFYPDIPSLCRDVDAVMLTSVDGRIHLEQIKPVIAAKKPVFVDKPLAATLADAREIASLAKAAGVPWFSASSLRYGDIATKMVVPPGSGVTTFGPGPLEPKFPLQLSWYAIHSIELLYALMGPGCDEVSRVNGAREDVLTGRWNDGRLGVVRTLRPSNGKYGAAVYAKAGVTASSPDWKEGYAPLVKKIVEFFQTGKPPVAPEETLEIFAFLDAAERSHGEPVNLLRN